MSRRSAESQSSITFSCWGGVNELYAEVEQTSRRVVSHSTWRGGAHLASVVDGGKRAKGGEASSHSEPATAPLALRLKQTSD